MNAILPLQNVTPRNWSARKAAETRKHQFSLIVLISYFYIFYFSRELVLQNQELDRTRSILLKQRDSETEQRLGAELELAETVSALKNARMVSNFHLKRSKRFEAELEAKKK